jgi:branched-chain amino acid transport system permease protein
MMLDRSANIRAAFWAVLPVGLMVLGVKVFWPTVPAEIYINGIIHGLITALIALGFVIIYRSNRIVNFAAADMGAAPASLTFLLYAALGWNIYLAIVCGFASALLLGVLVEFLFIRRFFNAPRLIATVATIGVTELLVALGIFLPLWLDRDSRTIDRFKPLFSAHFSTGKLITFDGNDILVLIVVPLVLIGLAAFYKFSRIGVALRAAAENADRASLLGIPVRRLQSVVWGLAGLLAFIAMFLRIAVAGQSLGRALDPAILLTALGAAVIGRMERMPTVVLAAVGLGVVDQAAVFHFDNVQTMSIAFRGGIILIALLLQRGDTISRIASSATSTWQATKEVRPVPTELRKERPVRAAQAVLIAIGIGLALLVPVLFSEDRIKLVGAIAIYGIIGFSLVILTGWAGQISLGQMGFVGIAGAIVGTIANRWHWDMGLLLLAGGVVGAVTTVLIGLPTLRARGLAFAIATLAFSLVVTGYLLNTGYSPIKSWVPDGTIDRTHLFGVISLESETRYYMLIIGVLIVTWLMVLSLRRSRVGRVLIGVRDNEKVAQAYSVGARASLIMAFAVSGFITGMAGALFVMQQQAVDAQNFDPVEGLRVFSMVVVGGLGSIGGVLLGAIFVKGSQWFITQPQFLFLSSGFGLLLVLLVFPGGLGAAVGEVRDAALRWYARRRGIRVPSLVADTRVADVPAEEQVDIAAALADAATHAETLVEVRE